MADVIFGVDILPGSSPFSRNPRYALVILRDGVVLDRIPDVTFYRLSKLIHQHKPSVMALDNVFELASSVDELRKFVSSLPIQTRLVQVTGSPQRSQSLQEVALEYGLVPPHRIKALEEAETCAHLAGLNAGVEVKVLEDETRILVTRTVSLGPGGSSQGRYRRSVHTSILRVTNSINNALSRVNLDFDLFREKSDFGLDKSEFIVYAPRLKLAGVVKPFRGVSIRVTVLPVYKEKVEFVPRRPSTEIERVTRDGEKKLIVGLDPGVTCGFAVLSFKGDILHLRSQKSLTRGDLTRVVIGLGETVVVATDVKPEPEFVKKFSSSLNSVLFIPEYSLPVLEKQELAQEFSAKSHVNFKKAHERDALAAAAKAYRHYKNKFEQIEAYASYNHLSLPLEEVKALVVRGQSIPSAFEAVAKRMETIPTAVVVEVEKEAKPSLTLDEAQVLLNQLRSRFSDQGKQIENLRDELKVLQKILNDSETSKDVLEKKLARKRSSEDLEIRKEREYSALRREIENLRKQLQSKDMEVQGYIKRLEVLRRVNLLKAREELILLKPIDSFTTDGIEVASKLYNIKEGDMVILMDARGGGASTAENLAKRGVKLVVSSTPMSHQAEETFTQNSIPIVKADRLELSSIEGLHHVNLSNLKKVLKESLENKEKEESVLDLSKLIGEYKKERSSS